MSITLHRMGLARRLDVDFKTLEHRQRLRELEAEHPPLTEREKQLTEALDIARRKAAAVPAAQFAEVLEKDIEPITKELAEAPDVETRKKRATLSEEYALVEGKIREQWIRAGLVKIEGGDFDGMTADELLDFGPPALAMEVYAALLKDGKVSGPDQKNSSSPSTSGAPEGGVNLNTIAPDVVAEPAAITPAETVSSISPSA